MRTSTSSVARTTVRVRTTDLGLVAPAIVVGLLVAAGLTVTVPAGTFTDCIKTEDVDPIDDVTEFKYYCASVGLVKEEYEGGSLELVTFR